MSIFYLILCKAAIIYHKKAPPIGVLVRILWFGCVDTEDNVIRVHVNHLQDKVQVASVVG